MVPGLSSPACAAAIVQLNANLELRVGIEPTHYWFCRPAPFQLGYRSKLFKTWSYGLESNQRIKVLQTFALPLGYRSDFTCREQFSKSLAAKLFLPPSPTSATMRLGIS